MTEEAESDTEELLGRGGVKGGLSETLCLGKIST